MFKSFIFCFATSRTCAMRYGAGAGAARLLEPPLIFAAFLMRCEAGGVRISKANDRSEIDRDLHRDRCALL